MSEQELVWRVENTNVPIDLDGPNALSSSKAWICVETVLPYPSRLYSHSNSHAPFLKCILFIIKFFYTFANAK